VAERNQQGGVRREEGGPLMAKEKRFVKVTGYLLVDKDKSLEKVSGQVRELLFLRDMTVTEAPEVELTRQGIRTDQ
jgi:hypothetical protein